MAETQAGGGGWTLSKFFFVGLTTTLVGSVALRMFTAHPHSPRQNPVPASARSLVREVANEAPETHDALQTALPYVTEASLFGLLGFALGYTSRKLLRLALVLIALAFVAVLVLNSMGKLDVDVNAVVRAVHDWVLNMHWNTTVPEFAKHRVPTVIAFAVGWFVGLRKG